MFCRCDIHFTADVADTDDYPLQPFNICDGGFVDATVVGLGIGLQHDGVALGTGKHLDLLPDFFGDERHQRVGQPQGGLQHPHQSATGALFKGWSGVVVPQYRLGQFQIPVAVLVPEKFVDSL